VVQVDEKAAKIILVLLGVAMLAMYAYSWCISVNQQNLLRMPFS
jgi:uncharacterized membrane protein (Fun14 family)